LIIQHPANADTNHVGVFGTQATATALTA